MLAILCPPTLRLLERYCCHLLILALIHRNAFAFDGCSAMLYVVAKGKATVWMCARMSSCRGFARRAEQLARFQFEDRGHDVATPARTVRLVITRSTSVAIFPAWECTAEPHLK